MNDPAEFIRLIQDQSCRALLTQEFWHHGAPADLVNVVFLQIDSGRWARFFFDAGVFFWREAAPAPVEGGGPEFEYRLVDTGQRLGLTGERIEQVRFTQPDPDCARLHFEFTRGTLILDNADDRSRLAFVERVT